MEGLTPSPGKDDGELGKARRAKMSASKSLGGLALLTADVSIVIVGLNIF